MWSVWSTSNFKTNKWSIISIFGHSEKNYVSMFLRFYGQNTSCVNLAIGIFRWSGFQLFGWYFSTIKKNDFGALILALGPSYQRNREMLENSKGNFVEKQLHFKTKNMGFDTNLEPTPLIINILCKWKRFV